MNHRVKLDRHNGEQVVHIPDGMELPGDEATIRSDGHRIVLEPDQTANTNKSALVAWLKTIEPGEGEWPSIDDREPDDVKL